jgi:hypothetical protein
MSREIPYRRLCPEIVQSRIEKSQSMSLYVVQELGPMAFIVREEIISKKSIENGLSTPEPPHQIKHQCHGSLHAHGHENEHENQKDSTFQTPYTYKTFKVGLGSRQTCNCQTYLFENELCCHIVSKES